ncbi:tetratricopeptide repeat protein [bacterium]|nr:tetratricopeptide repeat protein [bacterium]
MRTTALLLAAVLFLSGNAFSQRFIPKSDGERRGAESYNQAKVAYDAGDYAASIPLFLAADSLIGNRAGLDWNKVRFALGDAYLKVKKPALALEWFSRVAAVDSMYPLAQLQAAESARQAGRPDEALKFYRKALNQAPPQQKAPLLGRIAELQVQKGQLQAAIETFTKALALVQSGTLYLQRGQLYDRLAQAIDHAQDEKYDFEAAVKSGELTEEKIQKAIELREKALADYRAAETEDAQAATAGKFVERSEIILQNDHVLISEMHYQQENE